MTCLNNYEREIKKKKKSGILNVDQRELGENVLVMI